MSVMRAYSELPTAAEERTAKEIKNARARMDEFFDAYEVADLTRMTLADAVLLARHASSLTQAVRQLPKRGRK